MIRKIDLHFAFAFITVFAFLSTVRCIDYDSETSVDLSLSTFNPQSNKNGQAFYRFVELNASDEKIIHLLDVSSTISFIILQVHTQGCNISITFQNVSDKEAIYSGSNIGLQISPSIIDSSKITVINRCRVATIALITAVAYTAKAPIPGGCYADVPGQVFPAQIPTVTDAMVIIDVHPASTPMIDGSLLSLQQQQQQQQQRSCENDADIIYEAYRLYVSEWDLSNETYFTAIQKMITVDDIINNGYKMPKVTSSLTRMFYAAYPGVGSTYAVIAKFGNYSAAYVPMFSYACDPIFDEDSCYYLNSTMAKILCAFLLFIGIFMAFFGHKSLFIQVLIFGSFFGGVSTYSGLAAAHITDTNWHIAGSIIIGLITGAIFVTLWLVTRMPCIGILEASLSLGALVASTTYFGMSDGITVFKNDTTFWPIYVSIIILVSMLLCALVLMSNAICCAFLGSFGIILPIDYWLGSSLKYIIINTIRRITVRDFNAAIINPPIQSKEIWLSFVWMLLAFLVVNKRRMSNYTIIASSAERPILSDERGGRRILPIRLTDRVYQM